MVWTPLGARERAGIVFVTDSKNYGIVWVEREFKGHDVQAPCNKEGHLQLDQVAQSP